MLPLIKKDPFLQILEDHWEGKKDKDFSGNKRKRVSSIILDEQTLGKTHHFVFNFDIAATFL